MSRGFVRGYQLQVVRASGPVNTALGGLGGNRVPWGAEHRRVFQERTGRTVAVGILGEDLPEEHNQVTLDEELTDSDGIPAPKVTYTVSDNSRKILDHGIARSIEALEATGAKEVLSNPLLRPSGWHLMGTARMGTDPGSSVVDQWGASHDVKNLYIIDGSTWVTCGAVNPTSTIQALALYSADHIKEAARNMRG